MAGDVSASAGGSTPTSQRAPLALPALHPVASDGGAGGGSALVASSSAGQEGGYSDPGALHRRRSNARHKRAGSLGVGTSVGPPGAGSHYSKPIEMPPKTPTVALRPKSSNDLPFVDDAPVAGGGGGTADANSPRGGQPPHVVSAPAVVGDGDVVGFGRGSAMDDVVNGGGSLGKSAPLSAPPALGGDGGTDSGGALQTEGSFPGLGVDSGVGTVVPPEAPVVGTRGEESYDESVSYSKRDESADGKPHTAVDVAEAITIPTEGGSRGTATTATAQISAPGMSAERDEGDGVDGGSGKKKEPGGAVNGSGANGGAIHQQFSGGEPVKKVTSLVEQKEILQKALSDNQQSTDRQEVSRVNQGEKDGTGKLQKQITKVVAITKINKPVRRKRVKDGKVVFKGHASWEIVLSIQFGLQYTSDLLKKSEDVEPTEEDFKESLAFDFNPIDDQRSASVFDVNKYAKWVHPAPFVYRRIRSKFGVPEEDFLAATCGESRVRELPTPGKSGQIFYITDDENYFMKTIDHVEEKVLVAMLPSYYAHVSHNPNTFLTRYLAHFSVETTRNRHIRMVVMASVFNDSIFIDKKYDLKGSTYKRFAKPEELQSENVTLKDQDLEAPIFFNPKVVEEIHRQLEEDTAFLESHHVMDYSLLLGMSEMVPDEDSFYKETYGEDEADGPYYIGYQDNSEGKRVGHRMCIGVIDFLQRFRIRKKVEYGCRVLQTCHKDMASVAPPSLYRARFLQFLKGKLLPDPSITVPGAGGPTVGPVVSAAAAENGLVAPSPDEGGGSVDEP